MKKRWRPPADWRVITTVEAHAEGEPLRVITGGLPEIPGKTMLEKRRFAIKNLDHLRSGLMWEPRGHADMYGAILTDPVTPDGDLGVLFLHNEGFSTMCGHGVIALAKVVLDTEMILKKGEHPVLKMDTPAGRVTAIAQRKAGYVESVSFTNVPSFLYKPNLTVTLEGVGSFQCDVAFGGAFYAVCEARDAGVELEAKDVDRLINVGRGVKHAVINSLDIKHPVEEDLGFLYGTIFVGPAQNPIHHSRNVCIFAEGEVDRSPTGTGVSARAAIHFARNELEPGKSITIESILETWFRVSILDTMQLGPYLAVIPEVTGRAYIVGQHEYYFDPVDPLEKGFIFR